MVRIVCVLKSGGDFDASHVARLRRQITKSVPLAQFMCLTDLPGIPDGFRLEHDWPGWWSKIEVFRIPGPVLYLDLDVTINGSLRPLLDACRDHPFIACRDFMPGTSGREMNSSVMGWSGNMIPLYEEFASNPEHHIEENKTPRYWGDQGFIERRTPAREYWQDLLPFAVLSYKKDRLAGRRIPPETRVVCHHGKPRPWEI